MADEDILRMQPIEVGDAAQQLDDLAGRVERLMSDELPNLTAQPGARDEVSTRVADSLGEVHRSFAASMDKGTNELREVAATLRTRANDVSALDEGFSL